MKHRELNKKQKENLRDKNYKMTQHEAQRTEQKAKGELERQKLQNEKVKNINYLMNNHYYVLVFCMYSHSIIVFDRRQRKQGRSY